MDIRGQCRGRPPTDGKIRGKPQGLEPQIPNSKFQIPDIGTLEPWNIGTLFPLVDLSALSALVVKRRWGERLAVCGLRSAVCGLQSAVRHLKFGIWNLEFGISDPEAYKFQSFRARDWVSYTCSVSPNIKRDRGKDRLKTKGNFRKIGDREEYAWI